MVLHCTLKWLVYNGPFVPLPSPFQKTMVNRVYPMHPLYWIFKKKNDKNTFSNGLYQIDHFHFVSPKLSSFYGNNFGLFSTHSKPCSIQFLLEFKLLHIEFTFLVSEVVANDVVVQTCFAIWTIVRCVRRMWKRVITLRRDNGMMRRTI